MAPRDARSAEISVPGMDGWMDGEVRVRRVIPS